MSTQKQIEWQTKRHEATIWLRETFPLLFSSDMKPLKVGIRQDIVAANKEGLPEEKWIDCAIRYYVHAYAYLRLIKPGAIRFNLEGMPDGEVSEEDAAHAKQAFDAHKKKVKDNSRQMKEQRRILREQAKKEAAIIIPAACTYELK